MSSHTRRASYSKTCSATGPNAKAGEDWRNMQDLQERRRVQNRLAQRGYRKKMKDRLKKAGDIERRDASISPQSACSELDTHQLSPDLRDRGRSSGSMFHDDLVSRPQMALFPESYSEQYASVQAPAYQPYNGGYSTQSMDASSVGPQYSTLGDAFDSSYMGYSQNGSIAHQAPLNGSYSNSANQRQYHSQGASMSSSRAPLSPITSTSQGNFYSSPRGSSYSSQITSNNYGNVQVPYSHAYTESDTSSPSSSYTQSSSIYSISSPQIKTDPSHIFGHDRQF